MRLFALLAACVTSFVAAQFAHVETDPPPTTPKASTGSVPSAKEGRPPKELTTPAITTSLMFYGQAEEAMTFYTSLFKNSKVVAVDRWSKGEPGEEGKIKHAIFSLDGQVLRCMDSSVQHNFTFTAATSLYVSCTTETEIDKLFASLSKDGKTFMPLQNYPFAKKWAWVSDRFGVSWQLCLPNG